MPPQWVGMHRARKMAGGHAFKAPGVVAAAAAIATAASLTGWTDSLHPIVSPYLIYTANPVLLIPCASASAASGNFSSLGPSTSLLPEIEYCRPHGLPSSDLGSGGFFSLARTSASSRAVGSTMESVYTSSALARSLAPSHVNSVRNWRRSVSTGKDESNLKSPSLPYPSPLFPSILLSGLDLRRDEEKFRSHRTSATSSVPALSIAELPAASSSGDSWSLSDNFASDNFDTSDLASLLASFFVAPAEANRPRPHPAAPSSRSMQKWHKPAASAASPEAEGDIPQAEKKPVLTVVLLGWLGSQQKHLKKYAEWYNAQGYDAVTFTVPMTDLLSISMIGKVDGHVEILTNQLSAWIDSQGENCGERQLVFHTFSNAGWLTYGVVLEKLAKRGNDWADRIKGCVVDSAPAADPDPRIWANGFSAALLKKRTNPAENGKVARDANLADSRHKVVIQTEKSHVAESALHTLLEKFFLFFLRIPAINERLGQVVNVLSKDQPPCPQLYMYSTGDKIIPVSLVESFMEKQKQQGHNVRGWNFQSSPHVDHFRTFPEVYGTQVTSFLKDCLQAS